MPKRVAILQSNYIPWKGYFDLLCSVDEFIVYDDVQFTKNDWRNRNIIKTPSGPQWLTIAIRTAGKLEQTIREAMIDDHRWIDRHWKSLAANYRRAPHWEEIEQLLRPIYDQGHARLSDLNVALIRAITGFLGASTTITLSSDYGLVEGRTERLVDLCRKAGATTYVSGPAAKAYLNESLFEADGMEVEWFEYPHYPAYPQLWGEFDHRVSIIDLLFNCGPSSPSFMKYALPGAAFP